MLIYFYIEILSKIQAESLVRLLHNIVFIKNVTIDVTMFR